MHHPMARVAHHACYHGHNARWGVGPLDCDVDVGSKSITAKVRGHLLLDSLAIGECYSKMDIQEYRCSVGGLGEGRGVGDLCCTSRKG
jgi:hypothetical protein